MPKLLKLNKDSFLVALIQRYSSALMVQLSGFVVGMVVSKILGPEMLGYWGIFHIITGYYSYANLGATNGLTRSLGIALGQKKENEIKNIIGAAHAIHLTLPLLITFGLVIVGIFLKPPYNWIVIFAGIVGFVTLYEETLKRILSSFEKHKIIASLSLYQSIISILVVIPLVYFFNIQGRIIAALLIAIFIFVATLKKLPIKLSISFNKQLIRELIIVGFPIAMAGFLAANFFLVDRLVITRFLSVEQLGMYVFAFYLVTVVKSVKTIIASILYQRQNIVFGEDGPQRTRRLLIISKSAAYFTTDLTGVLSGYMLIIFAFSVKYLLPEYIEAIPLTFVIVFSQVLGSINVLNTVGKHLQYLLLIAVALIINIALSMLFANLWGLIGVAYATFLSFMIYNIMVNYYNLKYFNLSSVVSFKIIFRILSVSLYSFMLSRVTEHFLLKQMTGHIVRDSILALGLLLGYSLFIIPLLFFIKGHLKILNKIKLRS